MPRFVCLVIIWITFLGCNTESSTQSAKPYGWRVATPDRLYFKNTKAFHYGAEEDNEAHRTTFIHRDFQRDPSGRLQVGIMDDWLNDRAYLVFKDSTGTDNSWLFFPKQQPDQTFTLLPDDTGDLEALKLTYQILLSGGELCFQNRKDEINGCFLPGTKPHRALRETLKDFLQLVALEN